MLDLDNKALIGLSGTAPIDIIPRMANRHGLITGATGTGKTVTLQTLAETFSAMGVPVFAADVKGDLSGIALAGGNKDSVNRRVESLGLEGKGFRYQGSPVEFWDVLGEQGIPVRATIEGMGPSLMARLLDLNDTQSDILTIMFKIASEKGWPLIRLRDLKKLIEHVAANRAGYQSSYGNISSASTGAILRSLIALDHEGASAFFGLPSLEITDFIQTREGRGVVNILASDQLIRSPRLYTTFLLWLMNRLFVELPETGDLEKPRLVFFFDEAHLLFNDAPKVLRESIEQVVKLIRSKGVGIFFISQTPSDLPDAVLGQLGNRVQHALRAYTPRDQKALKAAAETFRANENFDTLQAIMELGTGEALLSFLDAGGIPQPVERALIVPPEGRIGPLDADERQVVISRSGMKARYAQTREGQGAYEMINGLPAAMDREGDRSAKTKSKTERAEERARKQQEKRQKQEAARRRRSWMSFLRSLMPTIRQLLMYLLKQKGR